MIDGDFHELTTAAPVKESVHTEPYDNHGAIIWLFEPPALNGVLTQDGVAQIAFHKYKSGSSTALDVLLNGWWQSLTDMLPMSIAPNMVTSIGAMHCLSAYLVTWYHTPNFTTGVPSWVCLFNAYCNAAYYTFDCMDGKQARRTGSSSPLGQLFDHGVDCLCLQQQLSSFTCCLLPTGIWLWGTQALLHFSFFLAQWEEYYTGVLPHATGNLGVTEVNYGLAVLSVLNAMLPDRVAFYSQPVANLIPFSVPFESIGIESESVELKHLLLVFWFVLSTVLCTLCMGRVLALKGTRVSALSKLLSPFLLCVAPLLVEISTLQIEIRFFSLAYGLALTQITIKLIVFSMGREGVAALQYVDVVPPVAACLWIRYDPRLKSAGIHLLLQILSLAYVMRIFVWTKQATRQICDRLDINLFTLNDKGKVS